MHPASSTRRLGASGGPGALEPFTVVVSHGPLILAFIRQEIASRYRGTWGGLLWSLITPLLLLAVYVTVFGVILQARWARTDSTTEFGLVLYAGLLVFGLFQDCLARAPTLITQQPNLVRKVVFPVEVLAWVQVGSAGFHFAMGLAVWCLFSLLLGRMIPLSIVSLPLVLLPVVLVALAVGWLLGALGVYLRDLQQVVPPLAMALLFLSPVFYDLSTVPQSFRALYAANPMTFVIEQARAVMLVGQWPDLRQLGLATLLAYAMAAASLAFFRRARPDFADAL